MVIPTSPHVQTHDYQAFSEQYSELDIEGTYYLAFAGAAQLIDRLIEQGVLGQRVLDFGCGTGRSTRFLKTLGLEPIGVDISPSMLAQARHHDPVGHYQLLEAPQLPFPNAQFDVVFQSFVLLEYASLTQMVATFKEFNRVLDANGIIIVVTGSEDYYLYNWTSFQVDVPTQAPCCSGDKVRIAIRGTEIHLFDYYWSDRDYRSVFEETGFEVVEVLQPLAQGHEPIKWMNELKHPCWTLYVLKKQAR